MILESARDVIIVPGYGMAVAQAQHALREMADKLKAEQAYSRATTAPVGQTIAWNNPETGNYGSVTPTREGTNTSTGEYCREFQQTVIVGGEQQDAYGTACRKPDGSWEIQ